MKRIITALVLITGVILLVLRGEPWLISIVSAIIALLAAFEYRSLAHDGSDTYIPLWWMIASTVLIFFFTQHLADFELPVLTLVTFILLAWSGFRAPHDRVLMDTAVGLFSLIYIVYPMTLIPLIQAHEDGIGLVLFLFACVWCGDIAALYVGKLFGKHKLSTLSPNKTWEGSAGSIGGSVIAGMMIYYLGLYLSPRGYTALHIGVPAWQMVILAVVLNLAAQLGDLLESAIKRGAGAKDSGTLLPGHGGVLDRIDSLLLAAPVLWYILLLKDWQTLFR